VFIIFPKEHLTWLTEHYRHSRGEEAKAKAARTMPRWQTQQRERKDDKHIALAEIKKISRSTDFEAYRKDSQEIKIIFFEYFKRAHTKDIKD